ncbi:MAG TPA: hypothetical protein VID76_08410 [Solirubrobacterales bacterium]|jgi:hypothetical protein
MLVAAVALTFAMVGTTLAADPVSKLTTKKVSKIANQVVDKRAPGLTVANAAAATHATTAGSATTAGNAENLGGAPASAYAKSALEPFHLVGTASEPPFENGWANKGGGFASTAFLKDPFGIVHLRGTMIGPSGSVAFTLPAGYRPAATLFTSLPVGGVVAGNMLIAANGEVIPFCSVAANCTGGGAAGLDAITFVAGQ